jgi:hypothetical protein
MPANSRKTPRGAAMQLKLRGTAAATHHLHVAPQHALRVAGAERLHGGFLRGKSTRKMNGGDATTGAVRDLSFGEDSLKESLAVAFDHICNTIDVGRVDTKADDV